MQGPKDAVLLRPRGNRDHLGGAWRASRVTPGSSQKGHVVLGIELGPAAGKYLNPILALHSLNVLLSPCRHRNEISKPDSQFSSVVYSLSPVFCQ